MHFAYSCTLSPDYPQGQSDDEVQYVHRGREQHLPVAVAHPDEHAMVLPRVDLVILDRTVKAFIYT